MILSLRTKNHTFVGGLTGSALLAELHGPGAPPAPSLLNTRLECGFTVFSLTISFSRILARERQPQQHMTAKTSFDPARDERGRVDTLADRMLT